jgi:hypothetical protein
LRRVIPCKFCGPPAAALSEQQPELGEVARPVQAALHLLKPLGPAVRAPGAVGLNDERPPQLACQVGRHRHVGAPFQGQPDQQRVEVVAVEPAAGRLHHLDPLQSWRPQIGA